MRLSTVFGFTPLPVTVVVCLTYVVIFAATTAIHEFGWPAPKPGELKLGLDIDQAARDLQVIARLPHPFNSARSDAVHDYILSRVQAVASAHPSYIEVIDDTVSNITFISCVPAAEPCKVVYYEGNNVLVKIEGTKPGLPAVLLNAHFDSVSTAPGATDDGMGATTMLAMVDYFGENRPERTLVIVLNNAEEDGLYGAHAFMAHPWSSLPRTFLNLEGLGEGGRPLFFRTSSPRVTRALSHVSHPHANSISVDAFNRWRLVRSGTDYQVFDAAGMQGLDLTFYKWRAMYHTKGDSVSGLGGMDALWGMMQASLEAAQGLMADEGQDANDAAGVTYFEVLGLAIAIFDLTTVFGINIALLVAGPLLVALLLWYTHIHRKAVFPLQGWIRFPIALLLSVGLTTGLGIVYRYFNPYVVHSSSYVVGISLFAAAYLSLFVILGPLSYVRPVHQQKLIVLLETYVVWWIALAVATGFSNAPVRLVSVYWVTLFNAGALFALLFTLLESLLLEAVGKRYVPVPQEPEANAGDGEHEEAEVPTERTPLVPPTRPVSDGDTGEQQMLAFWLLEYSMAVIFPVLWTAQTALLMMTALSQTLIDGSSPMTVYISLAGAAVLLVLPLAPFMHKMSSSVAIVLVLVLAASSAYALLALPFTAIFPFKVYFQQSLDLDSSSNRVQLVGIPGIVRPNVLPALPDAWRKDAACAMVPARPGLESCSWDSGLVPNVADGELESWITSNITRTGEHSASITVSGTNTRMCKLSFDASITSVSVEGAASSLASGGPFGGVGLWSRDWNKTFVVDVGWEEGPELSGRVACGWADMTAGHIPALDEVNEFLPLWVLSTKLSESLVEISKAFTLPP